MKTYVPTERAKGKQLDCSNRERVLGKRSEISHPLGLKSRQRLSFRRLAQGCRYLSMDRCDLMGTSYTIRAWTLLLVDRRL
jgi:hypothetical protein